MRSPRTACRRKDRTVSTTARAAPQASWHTQGGSRAPVPGRSLNSKCTASEPNMETIYVGIDVAKDRLDVVVRQAGKNGPAKTFANDAQGIAALMRWLPK